jgi:thiosulfate/3-mercaptopyruvate sulfurtransferase
MSNLIRAEELAPRVGDDALRLVDARFELTDPEAGRRRYREGHLPGALYLHLDDDLSGPIRPDGRGGRHPLPDPGVLAERLGALGIGDAHRVVAYDDAGGAIAARVWWLLRWLGHDDVRVLDGGVDAWRAAGGAWIRDVPDLPPATLTSRPDARLVVDADDVAARLEDPVRLLVDARAPERYRGETEPLDRKAGHVPGAINLPYAHNLGPDGRFLAREALRTRFAVLEDADEVVVYCGSGVTAAHDLLAIEEAGLGLRTLYAGAWGDWSARDELPVATGDEESPETAAHGPHHDGA